MDASSPPTEAVMDKALDDLQFSLLHLLQAADTPRPLVPLHVLPTTIQEWLNGSDATLPFGVLTRGTPDGGDDTPGTWSIYKR